MTEESYQSPPQYAFVVTDLQPMSPRIIGVGLDEIQFRHLIFDDLESKGRHDALIHVVERDPENFWVYVRGQSQEGPSYTVVGYPVKLPRS